MALERLQKIIAHAGLGSRREVEQWITEGRVRVDGKVVRELGTRADPLRARIQVDGKAVRPSRQHLYLALNKPRGYVSTRSDPEGRKTVMDLLPRLPERVYPVGRLDYHSEGLLLLTNDGEFSNHILSSSSGIKKTYWVKVAGTPKAEELERLRTGIRLDGRMTLPAGIRRLPALGHKESANPWYEVVLQEGRQNQIRRMFERIGHPVRKLKRVGIGSVSLGKLEPGRVRHLRPSEVEALLHPIGLH
jgi:23S rRNA pseudouridine2605 synthase